MKIPRGAPMSNLRHLVVALVLLMLGARPCAAQAPPMTEKPERPAPAFQVIVAVCCSALVLFIVCKPSRKGTPT
jgi:hypothetical protein